MGFRSAVLVSLLALRATASSPIHVLAVDDTKYLIETEPPSSFRSSLSCPSGVLGLHYPTEPNSKLFVNVKQGPAYFGQVMNTYRALKNNELELAVSLSPTAEGRHAYSYLLTHGKGYSPQDSRLSNCTHLIVSKLLNQQISASTTMQSLLSSDEGVTGHGKPNIRSLSYERAPSRSHLPSESYQRLQTGRELLAHSMNYSHNLMNIDTDLTSMARYGSGSPKLKAPAQARVLWDNSLIKNKTIVPGAAAAGNSLNGKLQHSRVEMMNENIIANFSKSQVPATHQAASNTVPSGRSILSRHASPAKSVGVQPKHASVVHLNKRQSIDVQCFQSSAGIDIDTFNSMYAALQEQPRNVQVVFENSGNGIGRAVFKAGQNVSLVAYHDGVVVTTIRNLLPLILAAHNECFQQPLADAITLDDGQTADVLNTTNSTSTNNTPLVLSGIKSRSLGMTIYITDADQASLI